MSFLKPTHFGFLTAAFCALLPHLAHAQDRDATESEADEHGSSKWGIGVGASLQKSPYKGIGNDNSYIPLISYEFSARSASPSPTPAPTSRA